MHVIPKSAKGESRAVYQNCQYESAGKFISRETWIHPKRRISSYEILYVTSGEVAIREDSTDYLLQRDDVLLLRAGHLHYGVRESDNVEFYWLHFHLAPDTALPEPLEQLHACRLTDAGYVGVLANQLIHYANMPDIPAEAADYLIRLVLMELVRQKKSGMSAESMQAVRIREWINANAHMHMTVRNVAEQFNYNEDYANRLFRKYYGMSLKKAIDAEKMQAIKSMLLTTNFALKEIATSMGFPDYKYFLKFFQYHEGMPPTQFRSMYYQTHMNTNDCKLPYTRKKRAEAAAAPKSLISDAKENTMPSMPKAVIFDLDGTLAYTLPDALQCVNRMLAEFDFPTIDEARILLSINEGEREYIRGCLPEGIQRDEDTVEACRSRYAEIYDTHFCDSTSLYPGLSALLDTFKAQKIPMAVNTNKAERHAIPMVEKLCPGLFDTVIGGGSFPSKPDPSGALSIARQWNLDPSGIWYVGDSHIDMETAKNAGMIAIGAAWGYRSENILREHGAAVIVHNADELGALLKQ